MRIATVKLRGVTAYSQSRPIIEPRADKESAADHDERCWRQRMHSDDKGNIVIPPMALKHAVAEAAQFLGEKIPGKRNATWTKHFLAGILCMDPPVVMIDGKPLAAKDVDGESLFVPSDGKRGGGSRVWRKYPRIPQAWQAEAMYYVLDDTITEDVFEHVLRESGKFIGIGRFRPRNGGYYGRYEIDSVVWGE